MMTRGHLTTSAKILTYFGINETWGNSGKFYQYCAVITKVHGRGGGEKKGISTCVIGRKMVRG